MAGTTAHQDDVDRTFRANLHVLSDPKSGCTGLLVWRWINGKFAPFPWADIEGQLGEPDTSVVKGRGRLPTLRKRTLDKA
jgi:hypothetical protein